MASAPPTRSEATGNESGYDIGASVLPNTNLVRIDVEGANADNAAAIANRIPALLSRQARAMYKVYGVTPVSEAAAFSEVVSPNTGRAIASGLLIGLILGVVIAYAMEKSRFAARSFQA